MMMKTSQFIKYIKYILIRYKYEFIIISVWLIASILNIQYGKYLLGWDNLQVELNYWVNIKRSFFSAWNEYYGLGAPSGHPNSVEFLRMIFHLPLYLLSPEWLFRYLVHLTSWLIGGLSVFYLVKLLIGKNTTTAVKSAALVTALFYMFNLGTVQVFHAPLEPFSFFYSFLPLSIFGIFLYLRRGGVKVYLFLVLSLLLITFSFQIQTFFVVFSIVILPPLIAASIWYLVRRKWVLLKRIFLVFVALFFTNIYWVPVAGYFAFNSIDIRFESLTNRLSSEDAFLNNLKYANINDLTGFKTFWLGNQDYDQINGLFYNMFHPWLEWIGHNTYFSLVFNIILLIGITSIIIGLLKKRFGLMSLLSVWIIGLGCFFLLSLNNLYPLNFVYKFLIHDIDILREMFRYTFTKWGTVFILGYTLVLGFGFYFILNLALKVHKSLNYKKIHINLVGIITLILAMFILYSVKPIFNGQLFYDSLEINLPNEYKETFSYFKDKEPNARIANLPQPVFWGWYFTEWGYRGSGFLWWGIEQPIMDRAFDVWSIRNERYFKELQYALYGQNEQDLINILDKYEIQYLLLDESVVVPNSPRATNYDQINEFLGGIDEITLEEKYGFISIYKYKLSPATIAYDSGNYESSFIDLREDNFNYKNSQIYPYINDKSISDATQRGVTRLEIPEGYNKLRANNSYVSNWVAGLFDIKLEDKKVLGRPSLPYVVDKEGHTVGKFLSNNFEVLGEFENIEFIDPQIIIGGDLFDPNKFLHKSFLMDRNESIYVIDKENAKDISVVKNIYSSEVDDCGYSGSVYGKDYDIYPDSIIVFTDNLACLDFDVISSGEKNRVVKIQFKAKIDGHANAYYCLQDVSVGKCLNKKYLRRPLPTSEYVEFVDYVYVDSDGELSLNVSLDNDSPRDMGKLHLRDISVTSYPSTEIEVDFDKVIFNLINDEIDVSNYENSELYLIADTTITRDFEWFTSQLSNDVYHCNLDGQIGEIEREINNSVEYISNNAVLCDKVKTPFDSRGSYLIEINAENIDGLPLELCIESLDQGRCVVRNRLDGRSYYFLPETMYEDSYFINFSNKSIGEQVTTNTINDFNVTYIPYRFLKSIYLTSEEVGDSDNFSVNRANRDKIWKYSFELTQSPSVDGQDQVLTIDQNYNEGWIVFDQPFTLSKGNLQHVLFNNWANGWLIPNENASYTFIYWPQYMQFIGYLFTGIFLLVLIVIILIRSIRRSYRSKV